MARLASREKLHEIIDDSPARAIVFHAIADSQNSTDLLSEFEGSRIVWVYRQFPDVANSALAIWGDHQKDLIRRVHERRFDQLAWRGERLPDPVIETLSDLYDPAMSPFEGACLFWYMRNQFFLELGLEKNESVFLLRYEDFVRNPVDRFGMLFEWLGLPFDPSLTSHVFSSSIGRRKAPQPAPAIAELCTSLQNRLDDVYARQLGRSGRVYHESSARIAANSTYSSNT